MVWRWEHSLTGEVRQQLVSPCRLFGVELYTSLGEWRERGRPLCRCVSREPVTVGKGGQLLSVWCV